MLFRVLGPLSIEDDGGDTLAVNAQRQRSVVAMLLIAEGETVSADRLIESIWGDDLPANPANTLQNSVAQLRKTFEPNRARNDPPTVLLSTPTGYRLDLDAHDVDARSFEQGLTEARRLLDAGHAAQALATVKAALDLWRGQAYVDFLSESFADGERDRLEELRLDAREVELDAQLIVDGPDEVIAELERLVKERPYREGLWGRLMTALYQAGRQSEALRTYRRASEMLAEELGLDASPVLQELEEKILLQDPDLAPSSTQALHNIPAPVTTLVGRDDAVAGVVGAVSEHRMVSLLGPGGSGKTRLAIEVAWRLVHESHGFRDGVWLVRLDDLSDAALLDATVGAVIGMPESATSTIRQTLVDHVRSRTMLLLLDNCEHLLAEVAALTSDLLERSPGLTILATSQAPLEVKAEHRIRVPPLELPGEAAGPFAELGTSPAVELFVDRARQIDPTIEFDAGGFAAIANIVTALDGMPLAIELAASRVVSLAPAEIARLMADRFDLLSSGPADAPGRQRSLRAAMEWSYNLLSPDDQAVFRALTTFVGGFDLAAAAAVAGLSTTEAADAVSRLIGYNLVSRQPDLGTVSRYRMLESLRQYGLGLAAEDEAEQLQRRHAEWFVQRAIDLEDLLMGPDQAEAFATIVADEDNIRSAMAWTLEEDARLAGGVRAASRMGRFWDWRGSLSEANTWLDRYVEAIGDRTEFVDQPYLVSWSAFFTSELGDRETARERSSAALRIAEAQQDRLAIAAVSTGHVLFARLSGDFDRSLQLSAQIRDTGLAMGAPWFAALARNNDAYTHLASGDLDAAQVAADQSKEEFEAVGDERATGWAIVVQAEIAAARGEHDVAHRLALDAASLAIRTSDGRSAAWASELAASAARQLGREADAQELEAQVKDLLNARGMPIPPWER